MKNDPNFTLAGWYADPMSREQAAALLQQIQSQLQQAFKAGAPSFTLRLQEMIARYWLGEGHEIWVLSLQREAATETEKALVELIWGQLLCSQKQQAAIPWLKNGFELARHLLSATDYFKIQKRHETLFALAFTEHPSPPQPLEGLLKEARVIIKLKAAGKPRRPVRHHPGDTTD